MTIVQASKPSAGNRDCSQHFPNRPKTVQVSAVVEAVPEFPEKSKRALREKSEKLLRENTANFQLTVFANISQVASE